MSRPRVTTSASTSSGGGRLDGVIEGPANRLPLGPAAVLTGNPVWVSQHVARVDRATRHVRVSLRALRGEIVIGRAWPYGAPGLVGVSVSDGQLIVDISDGYTRALVPSESRPGTRALVRHRGSVSETLPEMLIAREVRSLEVGETGWIAPSSSEPGVRAWRILETAFCSPVKTERATDAVTRISGDWYTLEPSPERGNRPNLEGAQLVSHLLPTRSELTLN